MRLRNIPESIYKEFGVRLPTSWQKRCNHFFSEMHRVEKGVECWEKGDLDSFGRLINESGMSSIVNYECGSPWLIKLYDILSKLDGVYGARFSGAGFKGCCMALIDPEKADEIKKTVEEIYAKTGMTLTDAFNTFIQQSLNVEGLPFIVTKNSKEALREQSIAMLMLDLKRAEERAEVEGWIDADDLEKELGVHA